MVFVILLRFLKLIPWEASSRGIKHRLKTSAQILFLGWFSSGLKKKKSQYVYWEHKYLTVFIVCHIFFPLSFLELFCISVIFYTQTLLSSPSWNRSTLYCHHFFAPKLLLVFLRNSCRFVSSFGKTWLSGKPVVLLPLREWFYAVDSLGCGAHFSEAPVS